MGKKLGKSAKGRALVFSGGGAKGVFELGAWRAFREMGLEFDAVAGASVGSLNAALYAQDRFDLAEEIWSTLSIEKIVTLPRHFVKDGKMDIREVNLDNITFFNKALFKKGGLDSSPLYELLNRYLDEKAIRRRGVDLGIVTVEVKGLKAWELFLDQMEEGQLADYLLASASFPAFEDAVFNGRRFTDGGIANNIPHSMMKERGYRDITVVDVSGMGMNRKPEVEGTCTTYIKNSLTMGGVLDFSPDFLKSYGELGYWDTLQTLGRLEGTAYFIKPGKPCPSLEKGLGDSGVRAKIRALFPVPEDLPSFPGIIRSLLPREYAQQKNLSEVLLECAALSLQIPRDRLYTWPALAGKVDEAIKNIDAGDPLPLEDHLKKLKGTLEEKFGNIRPEESSGVSSYEYALRAGLINPDKPAPGLLKAYVSVHPPLAGAVIYGLLRDYSS